MWIGIGESHLALEVKQLIEQAGNMGQRAGTRQFELRRMGPNLP